jgi:dTDP-4-amino-4,6-dideoxygalactose transaminase
MTVPLLDLSAQHQALEAELREAFLRVLHSGHFILGPEVERYEKMVSGFTGAKHALGVSSGTDALLLALMALGIGPGDEVLCPSFTFFATAGCVARVGAKPVFVDSDPILFNLDVDDAERRTTPRTKAIIPVHLFGQAADMDRVALLARKRGLRVIEDAAQSLGAVFGPRQTGTMGDFGAVSFFPTKNLGALGDAGALLTNDDELFQGARILRVHGSEPKYHHHVIGGNFRLDALQAALLGVKLPHLPDYTASRRRNAALYAETLGAQPGVETARASDKKTALLLPAVAAGRDHIWNQYTVRVLHGRRDALRAHLTARGIGSEIYYPIPLHEQRCFAYLDHRPDDFPVAHQLAGEVLSLPIYPELGSAAIGQVCAAIAEFLRAG